MAAGNLLLSTDGDRRALAATGAWVVGAAGALEDIVSHTAPAGAGTLVLDLGRIEALDVYGAWLLQRVVRDATARGQSVRLEGVPEQFRALIERVAETNRQPAQVRARSPLPLAAVERTGRAVVDAGIDLLGLVATIGALASALGRALLRPGTLRFTSIVHHLDRVGWQAVPIVVLITFLIGCIISQQAIFHFRKFGADDYVVDLVGILILREIGVLLVAIMVAGRSGSAYTAELGSMKMREEIDALRTMGRDPVQVLLLPRVLALLLGLPMLTFLGSIAALVGAGLVVWVYGDLGPAIFLSRLREAASSNEFWVGMIKAPFIALIIGAIACREGLAVKGSAESLGLHTTSSVVKAIFLVIVLDGLFAIFFASIGM